MAGEDFAFYLQERPGCFYRLGTGNEAAGIVHGLHTSRFTVDEEALRTGAGFLAYLAWHHNATAAADEPEPAGGRGRNAGASA